MPVVKKTTKNNKGLKFNDNYMCNRVNRLKGKKRKRLNCMVAYLKGHKCYWDKKDNVCIKKNDDYPCSKYDKKKCTSKKKKNCYWNNNSCISKKNIHYPCNTYDRDECYEEKEARKNKCYWKESDINGYPIQKCKKQLGDWKKLKGKVLSQKKPVSNKYICAKNETKSKCEKLYTCEWRPTKLKTRTRNNIMDKEGLNDDAKNNTIYGCVPKKEHYLNETTPPYFPMPKKPDGNHTVYSLSSEKPHKNSKPFKSSKGLISSILGKTPKKNAEVRQMIAEKKKKKKEKELTNLAKKVVTELQNNRGPLGNEPQNSNNNLPEGGWQNCEFGYINCVDNYKKNGKMSQIDAEDMCNKKCLKCEYCGAIIKDMNQKFCTACGKEIKKFKPFV